VYRAICGVITLLDNSGKTKLNKIGFWSEIELEIINKYAGGRREGN